MSMLLIRPSTGTGAPESPVPPVLHARIAWRTSSFTVLPWDGSTTTGWTTDGSVLSGPVTSLSSTSSDSFGGGSSLEMVTAGTAASGVDYALTGTFTSGRTYRLRAGVKNVSGSTSLVLRLGNAADSASSTATITTGWAWYTVDWTPSDDRTDAVVSLRNGAAATQTTRLDHVEVYEALDEISIDSLTVGRGASFDGSTEPPGTISLGVLDPTDTYTPRNTASPLYGLVRPRRRVHVRATHNGRLYAVAYGVIRSVTPDPSRRAVIITAEDGLRELDGYSTYRSFTSDLTYAQARAAALSSEALAATQHTLATDSIEGSSFFDGTEDTVGLMDYLARLNAATGSIHWCAPHVEAARPWRYRTMTRTTLTGAAASISIDEDFQTLDEVTLWDEALVTRQRASWRGYEQLTTQAVATATPDTDGWRFADDEWGMPGEPLMPITLASAESRSIFVNFSWPMEDLSVALVASGTSSTSLQTWSQSARIDITAGTAITVAGVVLTATPWRPLGDREVTVTSGTPVVEGSSIDPTYVASEPMATGRAAYVAWRYGTERLRPTLVDKHQYTRQLTLDVGSRVLLSADRWKVDAVRMVVRSISHEVSSGGFQWLTTYGLEELPTALEWLTLGDGFRSLDSSAVLAY